MTRTRNQIELLTPGGSGIHRGPDSLDLRQNTSSTGWPQVAHGRGQISVPQPLLHGLKGRQLRPMISPGHPWWLWSNQAHA
jgi:hypothetical protein